MRGSVMAAPESAKHWSSNRTSRFYKSFTGDDLRLRMRFFLLAGPGPPVVNGIFEVCHWTRASFLTKYCRRPLRSLSGFFFRPRAAGSESLKLNFKMSVCSRSVFDEETSGKWHLLELSVPYLRLFSFCDYTISQP